jgi:hypothetical protein
MTSGRNSLLQKTFQGQERQGLPSKLASLFILFGFPSIGYLAETWLTLKALDVFYTFFYFF